MLHVCQEKQHSFRNSVQCLEGWIRQLWKEKKIDLQEKDIGMMYLKRLVVCSKLDERVKDELDR